MTREHVAALLKSGVLQAFAEGKSLEIKSGDYWIEAIEFLNFEDKPEHYRVKPKPIPHTFWTACKAIGDHGTALYGGDDHIDGLGQHAVYIRPKSKIVYRLDYDEAVELKHLNGTPFHQGIPND